MSELMSVRVRERDEVSIVAVWRGGVERSSEYCVQGG